MIKTCTERVKCVVEPGRVQLRYSQWSLRDGHGVVVATPLENASKVVKTLEETIKLEN